MSDKRMIVEKKHPQISINSQCKLLGLSKRSLYYGDPRMETPENLELMGLIDKQFSETPFYGSRRMTLHLNSLGYRVNRKRVQRLMVSMGIEAI